MDDQNRMKSWYEMQSSRPTWTIILLSTMPVLVPLAAGLLYGAISIIALPQETVAGVLAFAIALVPVAVVLQSAILGFELVKTRRLCKLIRDADLVESLFGEGRITKRGNASPSIGASGEHSS
jgi:hypothetical protein